MAYLDLVGEVFVLAFDGLQLLVALLEGAADAVELGAVVAAVSLGGVQLRGHVIHLAETRRNSDYGPLTTPKPE